MDLRSRLTYANVAATLALFLVIGGGTVYAASELGRNDVKSKNIAKGAVKTSDLASNAVIGEKVKDGTLTGADLQDGTIAAEDIVAGVVPKLDADVTGSATAGPQGAVNTNTTTPLPLSGTTSFTSGPGDVVALAAEAQFTLATTNALNACNPTVNVVVDGSESHINIFPEGDTQTTTLAAHSGRDADGPYGILDPGTPLNFTAEIEGDADCTASSRLDELEVRIVQIR